MLMASLSLALVVTEVLVSLDDDVRLLIRRVDEIKITLASDTKHTRWLIRFVPNLVDIVAPTAVSLESLM
jgi:hypothetical protein